MSATCSRMYAEHVITRSARLAIHFSTPWMCDCGCLSTQPWWRPYSVAWIVTANGQRKRFARWSPATRRASRGRGRRRSRSCPPARRPRRACRAFMCSIHVTNSPSSRGRFGSRTRWTSTPFTSSSAGDSSCPRVRTWGSTPWSARFSASLRTCRARPPSMSGGYSQERIRGRMVITARRAAPGRGPALVSAVRGLAAARSLEPASAACSPRRAPRTRSSG